MLPIVDKPAIQYLVEEAVRSGITDILIILGRNQSIMEDHFDRSPELEEKLSLIHIFISYHRNELRVGRLTPQVMDGIAEVAIEGCLLYTSRCV